MKFSVKSASDGFALSLLGFIACFHFAIFAQAPTAAAEDGHIAPPIQWSQDYKEPSHSNLNRIIATDANGFYALREQKQGVFGSGSVHALIEYYDRSMKLVKTRDLDLNFKGKDRELKDVVMLGRQLYLLTEFYNEKQEKTYLFAQSIKNESLSLSQDLIKIAEVEASNRERQDVFGTHISRDSSKILIYSHLPNTTNQLEKFNLQVYDASFNEVWHRDVKLPYDDKKFSVNEYQLDNDGNVFLLGTIYLNGKVGSTRKSGGYQYDLLTYPKDGSEAQEYKIDLEGKFITDLTFRPADNGDIVCSGFYSESKDLGIKGACFIRLNPATKQVVAQNAKPFDFSFVTTYLSDRSKQKAKEALNKNDKEKEPELYNYSLDKLILRSDGGAILIAEQYFVESRTPYNSNPYAYSPFYSPYYSPFGYSRYGYNSRVDYYYNFNDVIVVNIRPTGEIEWTARIPKRQQTVNDKGLYSSYAMAVGGEKLYFVYNEDPKNLDPNRKKIYTSHSSDKYSAVVLAEVGNGGKVKISPIFSNADANVITRPKVCRQIGRNEMVIYGERGNTYRFADLKLE